MQIHELVDEMTSIADAGNYFAIDNGVITQKIDYLRLAKAIIETYNGSTLDGSSQTLQNAISGLSDGVDELSIYSSSYSDFYTKCTALPLKKAVSFCVDSAVANKITGLTIGDTLKGTVCKVDSTNNVFDFIAMTGAGYAYMFRTKFVSSSEVVVQAIRGTKTLETDISALNTKTTTAFKVIEYSHQYSLTAGSALTISSTDFGLSTPTGYSPIAMARATSGHNAVCVRSFYGDASSGAVLILRNVGTQDASATATIRIIYVKTGYL